MVFIDDVLIACHCLHVLEVEGEFKSEFTVTNLGGVMEFLRVRIRQMDGMVNRLIISAKF